MVSLLLGRWRSARSSALIRGLTTRLRDAATPAEARSSDKLTSEPWYTAKKQLCTSVRFPKPGIAGQQRAVVTPTDLSSCRQINRCQRHCQQTNSSRPCQPKNVFVSSRRMKQLIRKSVRLRIVRPLNIPHSENLSAKQLTRVFP